MEYRGYPLHIIHQYAIAGREALEFARVLARVRPRSLENLKGISRRRRDVLPHGALVFERLLERVAPTEVVFSAYGIREGVACEAEGIDAGSGDPLVDYCRVIGQQFARMAPEGEALFAWIAGAFPGRDPVFERLIRASCWLGDVAGRDHPDYRAQHGAERVLRMPVVALSHAERAFLAAVIADRYDGPPGADTASAIDRLLDDEWRGRAKAVGRALRLAFSVSPGGRDMLGVTELRRTSERLSLVVRKGTDAIDAEAVHRRLSDLARALGVKSALRSV